MSLLVEAHVAQHRGCHEENKGCVEQNEPGLADVRVVEQDQTGGENTSRKRVARLPHNQEDSRNSERPKQRRECSVGNVGDIVGDIGVANVLKLEVAIVSYQPADKGEEELAERGVDIEEVGALEIV